jgi:phosphate:Na+ symporter
MFNFFGAIIFTIFLLVWGWCGTSFSETVLETLFPLSVTTQIAMFHTFFNVVCSLLFLPFIKAFVKISQLVIREKPAPVEEENGLIDLDERLLRQPSVALGHLYQEMGKAFALAQESLNVAFNAFIEKDTSVKEKVLENNATLVKANKAAVAYLVKLSASSLVMEDEKTISSLHYVLNDILRVGELADNVTKYTAHYLNDNLVFSGEVITMLKDMYAKIQRLYELSLEAYLKKDFAILEAVDELEDEIDRDRRRIISTHIDRLNEGKCQPQNSSVFINLVGNLERAADHITFVAHSIEQSA